MKRTALFILACAALVMSGCAKEKEKGGGGPVSTYKIVVDKNTNVILPDEGTITASFYPKTEDDALNTDITVTFKADPSLIDKYTERKAELLPAEVYRFTNNPVIIEAERRLPPESENWCKLKLTHKANVLKEDSFYVLPVVIESITGNANATFDPNDILFITVKTTRKGAGKGTEDDPFKIETIEHLKTMPQYSVAGQLTYFKLLNSLDFSGVENWDPINLDSNNPFTIDFNGNGNTISNFKCTDKTAASFFGFVSGNIHNLKFDKAVVTAKNSAVDIAIVAYQFGIDDDSVESVCDSVVIIKSQVNADFPWNTNVVNQAFLAVTAKNATFKRIVLDKSNSMKLCMAKSMSDGLKAGGLVALGSTNCKFTLCGNAVDLCGYNQKQIGGIVGSLYSGHISECWNTGKVEGNEDVGGIVGQIGTKKRSSADTDTWTVRDCYNKGQIRITGQRGGGICGCLFNSVTIERSYNTGDVLTMCRRDATTGEEVATDYDSRCIGGIAGHICGGAGEWDLQNTNHVTIKNCIVFSEKIEAKQTKQTRPGAGAIVGYTSLNNTYSNCLRSPNTKVDNDQTCIPIGAFDQEDAPPVKFPSDYPVPETGKPVPYHGKVTNSTLKQLVADWGSKVWNTVPEQPTLVNNPEPVEVTMVARYR